MSIYQFKDIIKVSFKQKKDTTITIVFLNQYYLVQKEVITALRALSNFRVITLDICSHPTSAQAEFACQILEKQQCVILFTINEWGMDSDGVIHEFIQKKNILHINWCVDDPFYEQLIHKKKFRTSQFRIDFVSDKDYVQTMRNEGYQAHFLPLATDPQLFFPSDIPAIHDLSFVGSSYNTQVREFSKMAEGLIKNIYPYILTIVDQFHCNNDINMEMLLMQKISSISLPPDCSTLKALFICKHLAGYLYRRDLILKMAESFEDFTVYGDREWKPLVESKHKDTLAYGEDLRKNYAETKINIDINRVVIRNGFTQRVFDVLACKSFLITSAKPVIYDFFETAKKPEIIVFRNTDELLDLSRYYLSHDSERNEIANRGYNKVLATHTYKNRIQQLFCIVNNNLKQL